MQNQNKKPLTESIVRDLKPTGKKYKRYDAAMKGLSVLVQPSGHKTYTVFYRANGKATDFKLAGCHELSLKKAREMAAEVLVAARKGVSSAKERKKDKTATLRGFLDHEYLAYIQKNHSTNTAAWTLESCFKSFLDSELHEITLQKLDAWRLKQEHKPATINRRVATLKAAMTKAMEWGFIESNPLGRAKQLKVPKVPVHFLSEAQLDLLFEQLSKRDSQKVVDRQSHNQWLKHRGYELKLSFGDLQLDFKGAPTDYLTPLVRLVADTGLRLNEALSVRWSDISESGVLTAQSHKTQSFRYIPLTAEAILQLEYLQRINEANLGYVSDYLFLNESGERLKSVKTSWNGVRKKLGFACDFRTLRKTFGSRLIQNKRSVYEVSQLLGHSNVETTQKWYLSLSLESASAAIATIDDSAF